MKKREKFPTKGKIREAKIFNSWELARLLPAAADQFYISFQPNTYGRGGQSANFHVIHTRIKTDPQGHWMDNGHKSFLIFTKDKEATRLEAIEWANQRFGARDWVRDPFGSYQQRAVLDAAWQAVDKLKEEAAR